MITQDLLDKSSHGYDDSKIITVDEYIKNNPLFGKIIPYLNSYGSKTLCLANKENENKKTKIFYLLIFTDKYQYEITTKYNEEQQFSYVSCYMCCMAHQPMEDWRRMKDLADGNLTEEKLLIILCEIISNECQELTIDFNNENENLIIETEINK